MKTGFTLIELVVSMLIASMLALSLYNVVIQIRRGVSTIVTTIETDLPIIAFYRQLERDITGMFAPESSVRALIAQLEKKPTENSKQAKPEENKAAESEQKSDQKEKKIDQVFYFEQDSNKFVWSFITTGGIPVLDAQGNLTTNNVMRRVAYILQPNADLPGTYKLIYRQDTANSDPKAIKSDSFRPSYELASTIKHLALEFTLFEPVKQDAEKQTKPTLAQVTSWQEQEIVEKYKTLIPAYVALKGAFTDNAGRGEFSFNFIFKVYAYQIYVSKPKSQAVEKLQDASRPALNRLTEFLDERFGGPNEQNTQ